MPNNHRLAPIVSLRVPQGPYTVRQVAEDLARDIDNSRFALVLEHHQNGDLFIYWSEPINNDRIQLLGWLDLIREKILDEVINNRRQP